MSLIKDGNVFRTAEEQLIHLTEKHLEQNNINKNVNERLNDLSIASNLGGYNLVRFAYSLDGNIYYRFENDIIYAPVNGTVGDFVEIETSNPDDIPAYGYYIEENKIKLSFLGDYVNRYEFLTFHNHSNIEQQGVADSVNLVEFNGTSLYDYPAQNHKKQLFTVLNDIRYNSRTQYASFDLNNDGIYNFVYIGVVRNGKDGNFMYPTNGSDFETVRNSMKVGDLLLIGSLESSIPLLQDAKVGDIYEYISFDNFELKGNIRGEKGEKGDKGDTGPQGIQGVQGVQGPAGPKGEQGPQGEPGNQGVLIFTGVLNSPSELPSFSSAKVGDAYRVINTSGSVVTYDLYFKAVNGTTWDIQPNWGGVKGDKGDKGDTGPQGIQGVQGEQGPVGPQGEQGVAFGFKYAARVCLYFSSIKIGNSTYFGSISFMLPSNTKLTAATASIKAAIAEAYEYSTVPVSGCFVSKSATTYSPSNFIIPINLQINSSNASFKINFINNSGGNTYYQFTTGSSNIVTNINIE